MTILDHHQQYFSNSDFLKVVNHIRHLIREMIQGVIESERGGEIKGGKKRGR